MGRNSPRVATLDTPGTPHLPCILGPKEGLDQIMLPVGSQGLGGEFRFPGRVRAKTVKRTGW